jgi:predicted DsbA family dithiol-disulfide isomerase
MRLAAEHASMSTDSTDAITVYSDYVCPFCYLGRESLRQYQATRDDPLRIDWHPFDLRAGKRGPDGEIDHSVDDGKDEAYFERAKENVRRLQDEYGVEMDLELSRDVDSLPTQLASLHVKRSAPYETWLAFDEALLEALWRDGRDVGDRDVILDVANDVGLDPDELRAAFTDDTLRADLEDAFENAKRSGITGVPTFTYDDHAARGAVPPEHLERLVEGVSE